MPDSGGENPYWTAEDEQAIAGVEPGQQEALRAYYAGIRGAASHGADPQSAQLEADLAQLMAQGGGAEGDTMAMANKRDQINMILANRGAGVFQAPEASPALTWDPLAGGQAGSPIPPPEMIPRLIPVPGGWVDPQTGSYVVSRDGRYMLAGDVRSMAPWEQNMLAQSAVSAQRGVPLGTRHDMPADATGWMEGYSQIPSAHASLDDVVKWAMTTPEPRGHFKSRVDLDAYVIPALAAFMLGPAVGAAAGGGIAGGAAGGATSGAISGMGATVQSHDPTSIGIGAATGAVGGAAGPIAGAYGVNPQVGQAVGSAVNSGIRSGIAGRAPSPTSVVLGAGLPILKGVVSPQNPYGV